MAQLYGCSLNRRMMEERSGSLQQFAGVRQMTFADGTERGIRLLEFRTGSGLRFTVLLDRAMDIADCEHNGVSVGWHSPAGFRHPSLHEPEGEGGLGWLRSFSGLLVTCGLDHILFMDEAPAAAYNYAPRKTVKNAIHGRVAAIPARLTGYGEEWRDDETCVLWAEGVIRQGTVFGEHLELHRRIEAVVGGNEIVLKDRVVNRGFYPTPHMYCYHINPGYPVLDDGARYLAPIRDVVWAAHIDKYDSQSVGYRTLPGPQLRFHEQVWQHELATDADGLQPVALVNDRLGIGFEVETRKEQFPCMYEWQNLQAGQYALGIEPSTNHVLGAAYARERGELITLEHDDSRSYHSTFRILPDADAIAAAEARISGICKQPDCDYPLPSNNHLPLRQTK